MPLSKRFVADSQLYAPPDLYEESDQETLLRDISSAGNLGALHQISFLSLYAFEMFDNLSRLAEDVGSRIINASDRTHRLVDNLMLVEDRIQKCSNAKKVTPNENQLVRQKKQTMKFLKVRSAQHIPSALNKQTNCAQINGLYADCNLPPQFWKLETLIFDDCLIRYSNPGLFFEEWLKVELLKQEQNRLERKRLKKERKLAKKKRREEEALAIANGNMDAAQVRRKGLKDKKRKNKADKKDKAKEEPVTQSPLTAPFSQQQVVQQPHRASTTSNLFSSTNNYGFNTQSPSPKPSQVTGSAGKNKKPTKPPPSKPPPTKPPPSKRPPRTPTKPPPTRPPPTKPPTRPPPSKQPTNHVAKRPQHKEMQQIHKTSVSSEAPSTAKVVSMPVKDDDLDSLPPDDISDDVPPPDDDSDLPEDLPPPDDDEDDLPDEAPPPLVDDNEVEDLDEPPPPEDDEAVDSPPQDDTMDDIIEDLEGPNDEPPPDENILPPDDDEPNVEDVDSSPNNNNLPPVTEEGSEMDEEEDAFVDLPPPVTPVVQPIVQQPKRKQSILMISKDRKKMAEEASANLQRLSITAGADVQSDFNTAIDTAGLDDHSQPQIENLNEENSTIHSLSDSVRRKSFLNSNLNLGFDVEVPNEHVENIDKDEHDNAEIFQSEEEYYNYDQQYDEEQEAENYDEYYQDGYFWNGTEWVVADEIQADVTVDGGYDVVGQEQEEEEEDHTEKRQSALSLFGGGDMLASIRQGNSLRKVAPPEPKEVSAREGMLSMIKKGGMTLKKADMQAPLGKKLDAKPDQSDAIARLLSNRAQIAGSDSDSSDSDDSDSDDSYF